MAPSKAPTSWDDESSSEESSGSSAPAVAPVARRGKFDDEEEEEVLEDWEEEEDSAVEGEKAKKAAEAKAKADAEAKAAHKSRKQRMEERIEEKRRNKQDLLSDETSDEEEDEATRLRRARENEKESDLRNAEDLFAGIGVSDKRGHKPVTVTTDASNPGSAVDLSSLPLFRPTSAAQFAQLRETLVPLLLANSKKPQYALFLPELVKQLARDLGSEQVKKVAAGLNTMANEKMREEKAAEKGGKKSKAAKTKTSLVANRDVARAADTADYGDGLDEDDFM